MKLKLIENWKQSFKFSSMQLNGFAAVCDAVVTIVYMTSEQFPIEPLHYLCLRLGLTLAAMVARLVAQNIELKE